VTTATTIVMSKMAGPRIRRNHSGVTTPARASTSTTTGNSKTIPPSISIVNTNERYWLTEITGSNVSLPTVNKKRRKIGRQTAYTKPTPATKQTVPHPTNMIP